MNARQRRVLVVGAIAIGIMTLFPPWFIVFEVENSKLGHRFAGYHPIWRDNSPTDSAALTNLFSRPVGYNNLLYFSINLDTTRLAIQMVATLIILFLVYKMLGEVAQSTAGSTKTKEKLLDNLKV